jgi:hypothetical protein
MKYKKGGTNTSNNPNRNPKNGTRNVNPKNGNHKNGNGTGIPPVNNGKPKNKTGNRTNEPPPVNNGNPKTNLQQKIENAVQPKPLNQENSFIKTAKYELSPDTPQCGYCPKCETRQCPVCQSFEEFKKQYEKEQEDLRIKKEKEEKLKLLKSQMNKLGLKEGFTNDEINKKLQEYQPNQKKLNNIDYLKSLPQESRIGNKIPLIKDMNLSNKLTNADLNKLRNQVKPKNQENLNFLQNLKSTNKNSRTYEKLINKVYPSNTKPNNQNKNKNQNVKPNQVKPNNQKNLSNEEKLEKLGIIIRNNTNENSFRTQVKNKLNELRSKNKTKNNENNIKFLESIQKEFNEFNENQTGGNKKKTSRK